VVDAVGLGNHVKLPLGVHLRTGRRCPVLDDDGLPAHDPIERILAARAVALDAIPLSAEVTEAEDPDEKPWNDDEFRTSLEVAPVLAGCAVIRAIVGRAVRDRTLSREESVVLEHSLGHTVDGVRMINALYARVEGWPAEIRMGAPHRNCPVSCARIRKHLPALTRSVPCRCQFPDEPGRYPTPLRHARPVAPVEPPEVVPASPPAGK
jgi:hypothetical protein